MAFAPSFGLNGFSIILFYNSIENIFILIIFINTGWEFTQIEKE